MTTPTKKASNMKEGDQIVLEDGQLTGQVEFVYKCHAQVHILLLTSEGTITRSFDKTDLIPLAL